MRILIPIDLAKCPLEVFSFVNQFATHPDAAVTLLHVVNLNIVVPENRVLEGMCREAWHQLRRLAERFLSNRFDSRICVRRGRPAPEILAEAREVKPDWILLASARAFGSRRPWVLPFPGTAEEVCRDGARVLILPRVSTRFSARDLLALPEGVERSGETGWAGVPAIAGDGSYANGHFNHP